MPLTPPFYSSKEVRKPPDERVYHNNNTCHPAQDIPWSERQQGTGGYRLCVECDRQNRREGH